MIKTYFIGDLIDLVTDLGGTLKDSEKIWKEYINLLRNENVLDERFVLNEESSDVVKSGFQKAAHFLEKKLFVSGGGNSIFAGTAINEQITLLRLC